MTNFMINLRRSFIVALKMRAYFLFLRLKSLSMRIGSISKIDKESDSQLLGFQEFVSRIVSDKRLEVKFRSLVRYKTILEHVSYKNGKKYLEKIESEKEIDVIELKKVIQGDLFGKPTKYIYSGIGEASPTTLRYISVASDLLKYFADDIKIETIVEIGTGFGGQLVVCDALMDLKSYTLYDLPEVLELNRNYLKNFDIGCSIEFGDINNIVSKPYDLFISNYAFSELPKAIQIEYVEKILSKSAHGYVTMNSGRTNHTGRSDGKLNLGELMTFLPHAQTIEEFPKTGPDNYIVIW
jgi:putative sugar O-methyltransferase